MFQSYAEASLNTPSARPVVLDFSQLATAFPLENPTYSLVPVDQKTIFSVLDFLYMETPSAKTIIAVVD